MLNMLTTVVIFVKLMMVLIIIEICQAVRTSLKAWLQAAFTEAVILVASTGGSFNCR